MLRPRLFVQSADEFTAPFERLGFVYLLFFPSFRFFIHLGSGHAYLRARILSISLRRNFGAQNSWSVLRIRLRFLLTACVLGVKIIVPSHNSAQVCGFTERGIPRCS